MRVFPSFFQSIFSTTTCVEIPAWSHPGTQRALTPLDGVSYMGYMARLSGDGSNITHRMRYHRISVSCKLLARACPQCNAPVTFDDEKKKTKQTHQPNQGLK